MITKWKQYKCVINKHILDVHCVRLHNYVHWLSILLYKENKFILNQTHVVLEVFFFRISKHDQDFKLSNFVSKNECIESSMHKHFELSEKKK